MFPDLQIYGAPSRRGGGNAVRFLIPPGHGAKGPTGTNQPRLIGRGHRPCHIGTLIPAMGYGDAQIRDLESTINRVDCDAVIVATPIDLRRILRIDKPSVRVTYELDDSGSDPTLAAVLRRCLTA